MPTEDHLQELLEVMTCPVCLGYFKDPVMLDCGHNFCKACVDQSQAESDGACACPECRRLFQPTDGRPNWQLGKVVQLVKELWVEKGSQRKKDVCKKHQKPLKFFCKRDEVLLCVFCKRTRTHKGHNVALLEEAGRELKETTKAQLKAMEEGRKSLVDFKMTPEPRSLEWLRM